MTHFFTIIFWRLYRNDFDFFTLTLNNRTTTIHTDPMTTSPTRILPMSLDRDTTMWGRVDPTACIPSMSLIWDSTMSMATAEVKPAFTGPEMKSIKKPVHGITGKIIDEKSRSSSNHMAYIKGGQLAARVLFLKNPIFTYQRLNSIK